jgi:hypothetical protein
MSEGEGGHEIAGWIAGSRAVPNCFDRKVEAAQDSLLQTMWFVRDQQFVMPGFMPGIHARLRPAITGLMFSSEHKLLLGDAWPRVLRRPFR